MIRAIILFLSVFIFMAVDVSGLTFTPTDVLCQNTSMCVYNTSAPFTSYISCNTNICSCNLSCLKWDKGICTPKPCYKIQDNKCETVGFDKLTIILTGIFVSFTGTPFFLIGGSLCVVLGIVSILSALTCGICFLSTSPDDEPDTKRTACCCIKISTCLQVSLWIISILLGVSSFLWGNVKNYGHCPLVNPNF